MENKISIYEWIKKFNAGEYDSENRQIEAGWYDWFCKDSSLAGKTKALGKKLKQVAFSPRIDINKTYVFFKNNCPVVGNLYDDFRICDLDNDDVIYTVIPKSGHSIEKGAASVWGKENDFKCALYTGNWAGLVNWFNKEV